MTLAISAEAALVGRDLDLDPARVQRTIELLDDGNTIPFITRYRRDLTGAMDEEQIRDVKVALERCRALAERKATILKSIESQGKLTDEIRGAIEQARSIKRLEDLYLPFKPKKQTLATVARQRGLEPLAIELLAGIHSDDALAKAALELVRVDRGLNDLDEVYQGIGHLVAEKFGEEVELRSILRRWIWRTGRVTTTLVASVESSVAAATATAALPAATASAEASTSTADGVTEGGSATREGNSVVDAAMAEFTTEEDGADEPGDVGDRTEGEAFDSSDDEEDSEDESDDDEASDEEATGEASSDGKSGDESDATVVADSSAPGTPEDGSTALVAGSATPAGTTAAAGTKRKSKRRSKNKKKGEHDAFADYFAFSESLDKLPPHRVLAINRGERARAIRVRITFDEASALAEGIRKLIPDDHPQRGLLIGWFEDATRRLVVPSLEREIRRELTERAETHAVSVFARNLRNLLLQPPVREHRVAAIDPGYKSGCKVAILGDTGNLVESHVVFVVGNAERRKAGRNWLVEAIRRNEITAIAIGNGTASREAEALVADILDNELKDSGVAYVMVNEAGASVYSTSQEGREELPSIDATIRSAISIGRRLLDPLSELVKISAENLGVGLYQHDVKAKHLRESLDAVVESCVNFVGVDANTASPALLRYVSGLNQLSAKRFVEYRGEHGPFRDRSQFSAVPGFGDATFVQAAGFLKIVGGPNPLDSTWIHPESYAIAEQVVAKLGYSLEEFGRIIDHRPTRSEPVETAAPVAMADDAQVASPDDASSAETGADQEAVTEQGTASSPVVEPAAAAEPAGTSATRAELQRRIDGVDVDRLARDLGTGTHLIRDILSNLLRPGRDPRESLPPPVFRTGATRIDDLEPGMSLSGRILNVVDF
ncbi:MAG TPA: Tex-like N-terminal domain-containing protein, partial [Pirellulaceae bacterium]|nr:Tex-like N-terminal domain-containing protein [Pirellulaceae bacterium]